MQQSLKDLSAEGFSEFGFILSVESFFVAVVWFCVKSTFPDPLERSYCVFGVNVKVCVWRCDLQEVDRL